MRGTWRPLALAVVSYVTVGTGVAAAQTVVVRSAPPGSVVELALNADLVGQATADEHGDARIPLVGPAILSRTETDARVSVDVCDKLRRVVIVEPGMDVFPLPAGCNRHDIAGVFVMRPVTTFVVDLTRPTPVLWLRQGPVPVEWTSRVVEPERPARNWRLAPTGLVVSGGGGVGTFGNAVSMHCGTLTDCSGKDTRPAWTAGVAFWITRFLALEAAYLQPGTATITGKDETFRFDSTQKARAWILSAKLAVPIGPVRIYGQGGGTYHRLNSATSQTNDEVTTVTDGVARSAQGGTQDFETKTAGWGFALAGGAEAWVTRLVAFYAEGGWVGLKGSARGDADGELDDWTGYAVAGMRFRIGR